MYDADTFKQCGEIPITLLKSETREPNEVIGMTLSRCEKFGDYFSFDGRRFCAGVGWNGDGSRQ